MIEGGHDPNREIALEATELARQRAGDFIAVNRPAEPVVPAAGSEHAALLEHLQDLVSGQPSEDVEQQGVIDDHEEDGRLRPLGGDRGLLTAGRVARPDGRRHQMSGRSSCPLPTERYRARRQRYYAGYQALQAFDSAEAPLLVARRLPATRRRVEVR